MSRPKIVVNRLDAERLQRLIENSSKDDYAVAEALEAELERCEIVEPEQVPSNVVSMNSKVAFTDLNRDRQIIRTLVYPHALKENKDGLSVMAPIGAALLGLKVGDIIDWPLSGGDPVKLRIDEILWQPEAAKQYYR
ncbi:regulator of nucleoside diphosphate kinase [Modicisalibacter xianhensis]|uniref:Regulator of nucleoside diphosphate kinase n=1 Tax=Modicisalibacter xianhensis TaxID=442341 RepID=A0A4R8FEK6_9GAMM|nr:nucleoside diphosphate kinase regulator [Halomonas xianhensis]TDX23692.1 regulator of nucleoside diphosphate kinase [Halomonas xianhensis]